MNLEQKIKIISLYVVSYAGFLSHLGIESMLLIFKKDQMPEEDVQQMTDFMTQGSTEWMMGTFVILSILPLFLSILANGKSMWRTVAVIGGIMTILHALHFGVELADHFGGLGVMSILVAVIPSGWASLLAWTGSRQPQSQA